MTESDWEAEGGALYEPVIRVGWLVSAPPTATLWAKEDTVARAAEMFTQDIIFYMNEDDHGTA